MNLLKYLFKSETYDPLNIKYVKHNGNYWIAYIKY
jgi:hypothetical protein